MCIDDLKLYTTGLHVVCSRVVYNVYDLSSALRPFEYIDFSVTNFFLLEIEKSCITALKS